jgi:hypothetical protein
MPHFPKPFFRSSRNAWFVQIGSRQIKLDADKDQAFARYHQLMVAPRQLPVVPTKAELVVVIVDAFLDWVQKHLASDTFRWYRDRLQSFCGRIPATLTVNDLKPFHVQQWVDSQSHLAAGSRRNLIASVKRAMRWAEELGYIDRSPIAHMKKPRCGRKEQIVSAVEFQALLDHTADEQFKDLLVVSWESGCRPQESLRIEARHVDVAGKPKAPNQRVLINPPIEFELKTLDPNHPYLKERWFTDATIRHFGLGYCNRGMLKARIAIPLHDLQGKLVGYAGRLTKEDEISDRNPKYLFPGSREKDGVRFEFWKSLLLYNAHRIQGPVDHLFVVEGFPAMWWLWQAGYLNTVALMGSSCSEEQGKLIADLVKPEGKVWLMPDGNDAGRLCALSALEQVAPYRFTRWIPLPEGLQPTDCPADELAALFGA